MLPLLIEAAAGDGHDLPGSRYYPAQDSLLATLSDGSLRRFVEINYGPWDRLDGRPGVRHRRRPPPRRGRNSIRTT